MIKYLYGKYEKLEPFIKGDKGLRFTDLSHYIRLENCLIKDNELSKKFSAEPPGVKFDVYANGVRVAGDDVFSAEISLPVENHYCLCLSNKNNCQELFSRFEADVCVSINVCELVSFLSKVGEHYGAFTVRHQPVKYYETNDPPPVKDEDLVFYKHREFRIEDEYRIALKMHKKYFVSEAGERVPCFLDGESMHLQFDTKMPLPREMYMHGYTRSKSDA